MSKPANGWWRQLATIGTILVALGGTGTVGYGVIDAHTAAVEQSVTELRAQHQQDLTVMRDQVTGLRSILDALLVKTSNSETKLDMITGMLRDHTRGEGVR